MRHYIYTTMLHPYGEKGGEIGIDDAMLYGYWEHADGSEGGGLWFYQLPDGRLELDDFDGDPALPRPVVTALTAHGIVVGEEF